MGSEEDLIGEEGEGGHTQKNFVTGNILGVLRCALMEERMMGGAQVCPHVVSPPPPLPCHSHIPSRQLHLHA